MQSNLGLYVHLPWCVRKCPYCDFNSHPLAQTNNFDTYLSALCTDWDAQRAQFNIDPAHINTVFFGGGTPSLFKPDHFAQLLSHIEVGASEITMEANPGTTEYADFSDYRSAGINRLSLGAQSFNDVSLKALGRVHEAQDTITAFNRARAGGYTNINLDLMWGLPEQTVDAAMEDLEQAIALQPEHISWYQLTIEAKTEFAKRTPILPVENTLYEIEQRGLEKLDQHGFERYEVSAYARTVDLRCEHNVNYWQFGHYLGLGAGAHGKLSHNQKQARTRKPHQPRVYQETPAKTIIEDIQDDAIIGEYMLNALRLLEGTSFAEFELRTGTQFSKIEAHWRMLHEKGLVLKDRCATTALGLRYLDSVIAEFV